MLKRLFTAIFILLGMNLFSQYSTDSYLEKEYTQINLNLDMVEETTSSNSYGYGNETRIGPYMALGGAVMTTAGLLTVPDYYLDDNGYIQKKPFFRQGARMLAIVTGATLTTVGLVITISGN